MATKVSAEQVEQQISLVLTEWDRAKVALEMQGSGEVTQNYIKALLSRRGPIDAWAQRGRDASKANTAPPGNGWKGWVAAGNIHLDGIRENVSTGNADRVAIVEETIADVKASAKRVVKEVGATVGTGLGAVADAGGSKFAWGVGLPLILGAGAIIAILFIARKSVVG